MNVKKIWSSLHGKQSADDAFGLGEFTCEADIDRSAQIQRKRNVYFGRIDFVKDNDDGRFFAEARADIRIVKLLGGPYHGKEGLVRATSNRAFVIGDWSYIPRHAGSDIWYWWYDSYA